MSLPGLQRLAFGQNTLIATSAFWGQPACNQYAMSDANRRAWWKKATERCRGRGVQLHRSTLTKLVNEYLKGWFVDDKGKRHESNTPEHRAAAMVFWNKFVAPIVDKDRVEEWPAWQEGGFCKMMGAFD